MTDFKNATALVVDDDIVVRQATVRALTQGGFLCEVAGDGKRALARLGEQEFDLVVTDLRMPVMNGHQLAVEMLALPSRPVIIVLTGVPHPKLVRDLLSRGVDSVLSKPADYNELVLQAQVFVEGRKAGAESAPKLVQSVVSDAQPTVSEAVPAPRMYQNRAATLPAAPKPVLAHSAPQATLARALYGTEANSKRVLGFAAGARPKASAESLPNSAEETQSPLGGDQVAECLEVICRELPAPPEFDAFRVASGNAFGIPELVEAMNVRSDAAREVLTLANGAIYRLSAKAGDLEHVLEQRASFINPAFCLAVSAAMLFLGILIGHASVSFMVR